MFYIYLNKGKKNILNFCVTILTDKWVSSFNIDFLGDQSNMDKGESVALATLEFFVHVEGA